MNGISVWPMIRLQIGANATTINDSVKRNKNYRWINYMKMIGKVIADKVMLMILKKYAACVSSDILILPLLDLQARFAF